MNKTSIYINLSFLAVLTIGLSIVYYLNTKGAKNIEEKNSAIEEISDENTGIGIGISDDNIGEIVGPNPTTQKIKNSDIILKPNNDVAPIELSQEEKIIAEVRLENLRIRLKTLHDEEIEAKRRIKESFSSKILPSKFIFTPNNTPAILADSPQPSQNDEALKNILLSRLPQTSIENSPPSNIENTHNDVGYSQHRKTAIRSPYELKKGTVIPGILVSELNSDMPGNIVAQVRLNVYDTVTGRHLLIPAGSRLFGAYNPDVQFAQQRINVSWSHIIFPDGDTLVLEMEQGSDIKGQSGFKDQRKTNFFKNLGSSILYSVLSGTEEGVQKRIADEIAGKFNNNENEQTDSSLIGNLLEARAGLGSSNTSASSAYDSSNTFLKPTLKIRSGYRFNIIVSKDLILEPL